MAKRSYHYKTKGKAKKAARRYRKRGYAVRLKKDKKGWRALVRRRKGKKTRKKRRR